METNILGVISDESKPFNMLERELHTILDWLFCCIIKNLPEFDFDFVKAH
jgi:hypothetical protein